MANNNSKKNSLGSKHWKINKKLWEMLDVKKFKDYLLKKDTYRQAAIWNAKGTMIEGRCRAPEHAGKDENPAMNIFPSRGFSKCMTCGHYENDLAKVIAPIVGSDPKTAIKELQSHFNTKIVKVEDFKDTETYHKHSVMKNLLAKICNA